LSCGKWVLDDFGMRRVHHKVFHSVSAGSPTWQVSSPVGSGDPTGTVNSIVTLQFAFCNLHSALKVS
jgi:hypothetical protein